MPGVAKSNLEIDVDTNELRITGRRPMAASSSGNYLVRERSRGSFYQAYILDDTIDREKIDAVLEGGVLNLTLHRKESEKPRRIQIKS
jgi:HSP20 family protein